jgi:hypothetical protein
MKITKKKFIVIAIVFVIITFFIYGFSVWIQWRFIGGRGTNESYEQAKRFDIVCEYIPPEARKISYGWLKDNISASFEISEKDFIKWAKQKGWQLEEIHASGDQGLLFTLPLSDSRKCIPILYNRTYYTNAVNIISGYFYKNNSVKGLTGHRISCKERCIYDKDKSMGYFEFYMH